MKLSLSYYAERLWSHVANRSDVNHCARKKGTVVYWIVRQKEWIALRWCYVREYAPEVIRFTRMLTPHPPKTIWTVDAAPYLRMPLEVTLWSGELDRKKFERLAEVFTHPERALDWTLLDWKDSDTNLWSEAALLAEKKSRMRKLSKPNL